MGLTLFALGVKIDHTTGFKGHHSAVLLCHKARCASIEHAVLKMREGPSVSPTMRKEPNHLMRLSLRVMVVSDKEKAGEAAKLAERGKIAIYPAMGWWRTRTKLERYNKSARYALIVSISVPGIDTDIYTEVANQIEIKQAVEI